jgi:hypothetical protein
VKTSRIVILTCLIFIAAASVCSARSLMPRRMQYLTAITNKVSEATHWFVFLGQHECTLNRKFFGEDMQPVTGNVNLSLLSSGYIEGNGYSAKGKIDCMPTMKLKNDAGERTIELDSIDCIFDYGHKVRMNSGDIGDFIIDVEGQPKSANRFVLTEYKMAVSADGERELKKTGDDIRISAIAFSKDGIARAKKGIQVPVQAPATQNADTAQPAVK